jgi:ATP-dependent DNA helicase RecG
MDSRKHLLRNCVQYIKGVGPAKSRLLSRLGIETVADLLYYFPRRYEDRTRFTPACRLQIGQYQTVRGRVLAAGIRRSLRRGFKIFEAAIGDETGKIFCVWFNQPYLSGYFKIGQEVVIYGKPERFGGALQMNSPEYEIIYEDTKESIHMGRIVPIYPLTQAITQRTFRLIIKEALSKYKTCLIDSLPGKVKSDQELLDLPQALENIHFPANFSLLEKARQRLVFEEFFLLQLILAMRKIKAKVQKGISHRIEGNLIQAFKRNLPFNLTEGQKKAIGDIERDMSLPHPMYRLLQGDVASGKTIVAMYAIVLAVQSGFQAALMVPTEVLAEQHHLYLNRLLGCLGIEVTLLVGSLSKKERGRIYKRISAGQTQVIVGTHSLIQEKLAFKRLSLVVIDEQHKFGVHQRLLLPKKGANPDILIMTATPIPRTLALTLYGELDISTIHDLPAGRRPIKTYCVGEAKRQDAYRFIEKQLSRGRQAYIVYPIIEESASLDVRAACQMYKRLKEKIFDNYEVGLIHGRMDREKRIQTMRDFREGKIHILVSTSILEVGIDVPNVSVILIEHAERFGLSQLHQLRGRIGRGNFESYCILLSNSKTEESKMRMKAMLATSDGFRIAKEDLKIRGPGEFFGARQHGLAQLKIADLIADAGLLNLARREAISIVRKDPFLDAPGNLRLRQALADRWKSSGLYDDTHYRG